jgi:hypothetical protein
MKSPFLTVTFLVSVCCCLFANSNYPLDKLTFQSGEKIEVSTTDACTSIGNEKWNTITIRFPEPIKYSSKLIVSGSVTLKSDLPPSHIGFNLLNPKDRFGFAKVPASSDGETTFSVPLGDFVRSAELGGGPLEEGEEIWAIRVYASFPEPVDSTITLNSFQLKQD